MIRRYLLAGIVALLPLGVTLWLLSILFRTLEGIFQGPFAWVTVRMGVPVLPYWAVIALSLITTLVVLFVVGVLVGNLLGRQLLHWMDGVMMNIPLIKGVYGATKQLMNSLQQGKGGGFREAVLIEWPGPGSYTLGLVARRDCSWAIPGGENMVAVYVPTAPNPTSGYIVMVDSSRIRPVDISADQVLAWAVSGGIVAPSMRTEIGTK